MGNPRGSENLPHLRLVQLPVLRTTDHKKLLWLLTEETSSLQSPSAPCQLWFVRITLCSYPRQSGPEAGFEPLRATSLGSSAYYFELSGTAAPFCGKMFKLVP